MREFELKKNLLLGVATASTQIEGGYSDSNWDDWSAKGMIKDGSSPTRANDHYMRYRDDADLMKEMNIEIYRMSIEWSRLEPERGKFAEDEFQHYIDEIEYLQSRGIKVLLTLHHFNNPMWFERMGGFLNAKSPYIFREYVAKVVTELGRLITDYVTINEPNVYVTSAYFMGEFPPGHKDNIKECRVAMTNLAGAQILAYNTIHSMRMAMGYGDTMVGYASHVRVFEPLNSRSISDRFYSRVMDRMFQKGLDDAAMLGKVSFPIHKSPLIRRGKYYDFIGINYYARSLVHGLNETAKQDAPHNDMGWEVYPEGLAIVCKRYYERYKAPIYITENGTADRDDRIRAKFIYDHLRIISELDVPIERYYHWTFIDNFEWIDGEKECFGLVRLNYLTQERTVRDSGRFYAEIIRKHCVDAEMLNKYLPKA